MADVADNPAVRAEKAQGGAGIGGRRWWKRGCAGRVLRYALLLVAAVLAVGVSGAEESALREFDEATARWQTRPEFRDVALDYCVRGSAAMRTRPMFLTARQVMLTLRSLPGAAHPLAADPAARAHYANFEKGPLSAYLYLCDEQPVAEKLESLEALGRKVGRSPRDYSGFLEGYQLEYPVCRDAGAIQSVASLVQDTGANHPFVVRRPVGELLMPYARALSRDLGVPDDPDAMTPAQQRSVLERLDGFVRRRDPELWRTKQLSDFCAGVWGQVYGPPYRKVIRGVVGLHRGGVLFLLLAFGWWAVGGHTFWTSRGLSARRA